MPDESHVYLVDVGGAGLAAQPTHEYPSPERLIGFLAEEHHGGPFEMVDFTFFVEKCPMPIATQWLRHRMGSFNFESARYKEPRKEYYVPARFSRNAAKNLQGAVPFEDLDEATHAKLQVMYSEHYEHSWDLYQHALRQGVSREQARFLLPQGYCTSFYWKVNARSLANFLNLRRGKNAQIEVQAYAQAVRALARTAAPLVIDALCGADEDSEDGE